MSEESEQPTGQRFFRLPEAVYTATRAGLDAHYGHPKTENNVYTESCLPSAANAPKTENGDILVSLGSQEYSRPEVAPSLSQLISQGAVLEISESDYWNLRA